MSNFCTKCGAAVSPDSTFCPACGNTIAAAAPPAAFAAQPPAPAATPAYVAPTPPPAYPPAAAPPSGGGSSALKIILIIVGVIVLIGIIGVSVVGYGAYRLAHAVHENIHVDSKTGDVDIAGSSFSTNSSSTLSAADLGVDIYPGAVKGEGSMNLKTPQGSMITAIYTTKDPVAQVVDFYKGKLGDQASTVETGNGTMLTNASNNDDTSKLVITVTPEGGSTKIAIVHTTKK
jgi:hypothetical protein